MNIGSKVILATGTLGASSVSIPLLSNQTNQTDTSKASAIVEFPEIVSAPVATFGLAEQINLDTDGSESQVTPASLQVAKVIPAFKLTPAIRRNEENCSVVDIVDSLQTLLSNNLTLSGQEMVETSNFVKVECTKTASEIGSKMPSSWDGLFHKSLFEKIGEVTAGKKIEIKTQTSEESSKYKTTFTGSHFQKKILGEWSKTDINLEDKIVTAVNIASSTPYADKIYLMFKK